MQKHVTGFVCTWLWMAFATVAHAMDAAVAAKLDAKIKDAQSWAADPAIIAAVKARNANRPADVQAMTQEKWAALTVLDPFVRSLTKNAAAEALRTHQSPDVSEAFVSAADGCKVAFLAKTTNWSHKSKPKHEEPMGGKTWQGTVEVDDSTGLQQVQIAVPVLDGGKPIGSLVIGIRLNKLGS